MDISRGEPLRKQIRKKPLKVNGLLKSKEKIAHISVEIWIEILNKF